MWMGLSARMYRQRDPGKDLAPEVVAAAPARHLLFQRHSRRTTSTSEALMLAQNPHWSQLLKRSGSVFS